MTLLWVLAAAAAGPQLDGVEERFEIVEEKLDSGDTLVAVHDDRAPVVYLRIDIPVGSESPWGVANDSSTAWSIQHNDPDGALRARADELAISLRLSQSATTAWISVSCLIDDLDAALELAADVLGNTELDRSELKRWRKGTRLEWANAQTSPQWQAQRTAAGLLFEPQDPRRRHYLSREVVLTHTDSLVGTRDQMLRHPDRIIGVSGDVDLEVARRVAEALLPDAAPVGELTEPQYGPVTPRSERPEVTEVELRDLTQVYFRVVRAGLTYDDPDYPASLIANHVLAGHAHARLGQALRYDDGSTYSVSLGGRVGLHPRALSVASFTRVDNAEQAEKTLDDALATFHRDGITAQERIDAVTSIEGRAPFLEQNPWTPMAERMWEIRHDKPAGFREDARRRASELTLDEINAFIERFYDPAEFVRVRVVPR